MIAGIRPSWKQGFARSAAESDAPGLWKGSQGFWAPALGSTGLTLRDVTGRKRNGTLTNMVAADWVRGDPTRGGYALEFVATGDTSPNHVPLPGLAGLDDQVFSVAFHCYMPGSETVRNGFILGHVDDNASAIQFDTFSTTTVNFRMSAGLHAHTLASSRVGYHHWVVSRNAGSSWIYMDGQLSSTVTGGSTSDFGWNANSTLGAGSPVSPDRQWEGKLDSFGIWSGRNHTESEIQVLGRNHLAPFVPRWQVYAAAVVAAATRNRGILTGGRLGGNSHGISTGGRL